jgi:hypothetical protein
VKGALDFGQGWRPALSDYDLIDIDRARAWLTARGWVASPDPTPWAPGCIFERWAKPGCGIVLLPMGGHDAPRRWGEALDDVCAAEGIVGRERWAVLDAWLGEVEG